MQAKVQISEHRINGVNAKKLPENRPQKRRRYRLPKLTPNVSLQAGQETPTFSPVFLPTQTLTPIFHPYFFHPFFFHSYFLQSFHPYFFFTHSFFNPYFLQSFHLYFFHPYFFFTHAFYKVSPILFSPKVFTHTFFTHSFFHPYFLQSFQAYFCFTHTFHQVLIPMFFFNHVFNSCLLQSSLDNEPLCLVYFHHIIFIPHYVFTTFKA